MCEITDKINGQPFHINGSPFNSRNEILCLSVYSFTVCYTVLFFISLWKLPFNRFNKRLTVFAKYINCLKVFFSFSSYPFTVSTIVAQPKVSLSSNPHFSCFPCQIKPLKSFLITFRTILPIQNSKSSPKFKNPKSKP